MKCLVMVAALGYVLLASCKKDNELNLVSVQTGNSTVTDIKAEPELFPYNVKGIARVTGKTLPRDPYLNPNNTDVRFDIGGTDLGIMWDLGGGYTSIFFGDTFGRDWTAVPGGANGSNWRSNVVAVSRDNDLDNGLSFYGMATGANGAARQIIPSAHNTSGNGSFTAIPTAGIRLNGTDYVHYMDVRQWGTAGRWITNFSALYKTNDNGRTWSAAQGVAFSADSRFAMAAYAKKDGYVYMLGTPSGRFGNAYLARFLHADILKQSEYEYWVEGKGWMKGDETEASVLLEGPVGELSLVYNTNFKRWIVTYLDEHQAKIVMRDAAEITGPWSAKKTLVSGAAYPGLYGAFIHPQKNSSDDLYFLMSMWGQYNVFLIKAKLRLL